MDDVCICPEHGTPREAGCKFQTLIAVTVLKGWVPNRDALEVEFRGQHKGRVRHVARRGLATSDCGSSVCLRRIVGEHRGAAGAERAG